MEKPPYRVPTTFPSISQASSLISGYQEHHCKLVYESSGEAHLLEDLEQSSLEEMSEMEGEGGSQFSVVMRYRVTIVAALALLLILLLWLSAGEDKPVEKVEKRETSKAEVTHIQKSVTTILDVPDHKPLQPAVKRLKKWIKKKKIHKMARNKISTIYTKRSDAILKRALKLNKSGKRPRKVEKFLLVAIAFNPRNEVAWQKLIEHYEANGRDSKAASARIRVKKLGLHVK